MTTRTRLYVTLFSLAGLITALLLVTFFRGDNALFPVDDLIVILTILGSFGLTVTIVGLVGTRIGSRTKPLDNVEGPDNQARHEKPGAALSAPLNAPKKWRIFAGLAAVLLGLTVWFWARPSARITLTVPAGNTNENFGTVVFSPDGKTLAGASHRGTVKVWDAANVKLLRTLEGHSGMAHVVCFSGDGRLLASAGARAGQLGEIKVWDAATGKEVLAPEGSVQGPVALSADGSRLAGSGRDGALKVWDTATGAVVFTPAGSSAGSVAFSPDGKWLAGSAGKKAVRLWDATSGKELFTLQSGPYASLAFSPDGRYLATAVGRQVKIWDPTSGKELLTIEPAHAGGARGLSFSPDGKYLASGGNRPYSGRPYMWSQSEEGEVKVWKVSTGKELLCFKSNDAAFYSVCFSPDGKHLATSGLGPDDQPVKIWSVRLW